jgi:hypothetical protein
MSSSDQQPKITIESLIRLKRAERPAPEFWLNFDRELRQKQLAALVEKRPWWQNLPRFFVRKVYLPVGATAILTFTLVSVRYYAPSQVAQAGSAVALTAASSQTPDSKLISSTLVSSPLVNRVEQLTPEAPVEILSNSLVEPSARNSPADVVSPAYVEHSDSPSARSIAANLAHVEQSEPELLNAVLGTRFGSPARGQATLSATVVELASLTTGSARRTRLVAHYNDHQVNSEPATSDSVRERLSHRLADADFNDRFSRIGLKGDQVSLKF